MVEGGGRRKGEGGRRGGRGAVGGEELERLLRSNLNVLNCENCLLLSRTETQRC